MDTPRGYDNIKRLSLERGKPIRAFLALTRNSDPFFVGSPAEIAAAEWFADLWEEFGFTSGGVHVRRVHYRLVTLAERTRPDGRPYVNTKACEQCLGRAAENARYLSLVDPLAFVDRKNPPPKLFAPGPCPTILPPSIGMGGNVWSGGAWTPPSIPEWVSDDDDITLPCPVPVGYDYDPAEQPYRLELWPEKSTMNDELLPVCERLGINFIPASGFQSQTNIVLMLVRVASLGVPTRIFYVSDHDPAGDVMPVAVARLAEFWLDKYAPGADIKLTPLAITPKQIKHYHLPRTPIDEGDDRAAAFELAYGEGAVELDALEALHPGELARLVERAAAPYRDTTLERRLIDARSRAWRLVDAAWAPHAPALQTELAEIEEDKRAILDRYRAQQTALNESLQEEMQSIADRIEAVTTASEAAVEQVVHELQGALPPRPDPKIDLPDESDWLYDSSRSYFEQLAAYKSRRLKDGEEAPSAKADDGPPKHLRPTLAAVLAAPDGLMTEQVVAATGKSKTAVYRGLNELEALGLVEHAGNPAAWYAPGGAARSDGLPAAVRETVALFREAGGEMTTVDAAGRLGFTNKGTLTRLGQCEATGLLVRVGVAKKGSPLVWRLTEATGVAGA